MEDLARFFVVALPAAFYRLTWLTLACGAAFVLIGAAYALWISSSPEALRAVASEAAARQGESKEIPPELQETMTEMQSLSVGTPEFLDLREPWLDSPR